MNGIEYSAFANSLLNQNLQLKQEGNKQLQSKSDATTNNGNVNKFNFGTNIAGSINSTASYIQDKSSTFLRKNDSFTYNATKSLNNFFSAVATSTTTALAVGQQSNEPAKLYTDKLMQRLKSMNECPDYLMPKNLYSNSLYTTQNSFSSTGNLTNSGRVSTNKLARSSTRNKYLTLNTQDLKNYYTDDFILISEFSEIEGPKPLLTIPTDGGTGFNKNEYSLHLMCVDFHSHLLSKQHLKRSEQDLNFSLNEEAAAFCKFSLTKDTSIINYWDSNSTVAACVHHFTLYDLEARGFVRPFCIAYISFDRTKPIAHFESIRDKFNEVTDIFKKSNFNLFKHELEQRCIDLKYTRDLFVNWSTKLSERERLKLAKELNLDMRTILKLNSSSSNETNRKMQLAAINNLLREMELILDVVQSELKSKNWLTTKPLLKKQKSSLNKHQVNDEDNINQEKCSSAVDPLMSSEKQFIDLKERSNTFPLNDDQKLEFNTKFMRKLKKKDKDACNFVLRKPTLFQHVLIGNTNSLGVNGNIDFENLNASSQVITRQRKFKRLHQLCAETAKEAINQLRFMHYFYSTSYYLLKFNQVTSLMPTRSSVQDSLSFSSSTASTQHSSKMNAKPKLPKSSNLFWSITLGDCKIADFSTYLDTCALNKLTLIKKSNLNSNNNKQINALKTDKSITSINDNENQTVIYVEPSTSEKKKIATNKDQLTVMTSNTNDLSVASNNTQFFSPLSLTSNTNVAGDEMFHSIDVINSKVLTNNEESWENLEQYLDEDDCDYAEEDEEEVNNESMTSDESESEEKKNTDEVTKILDETPQNEANSNNENDRFIYEEFNFQASPNETNEATSQQEEIDAKVDDKSSKLVLKEENEYDFANSLLTLDYKNYNRFNCDYYLQNTNNIYQSTQSIASNLSISSASIALFYSSINYFNQYQTDLTSKLCQISEFNFEETLKRLINNYSSIFPHLLYSLLKGRPVICVSRYCNDLAYLTSIVDCLSNFIPNSFYCLNNYSTSSTSLNQNPKFTSSPNTTNDTNTGNMVNSNKTKNHTNLKPQLKVIHERKPIKLNDLKYCKLFGLNLLISKDGCCSSICNDNILTRQTSQTSTDSNSGKFKINNEHKHKHYHFNPSYRNDSDLLLDYIPITVQNYVSVFDLDKQTFLGPKYKGQYLINCVEKCKLLQQDSICYLYLLAHVAKYYVRCAFIYNYSILFDVDYSTDSMTSNESTSYKRRTSELDDRSKSSNSPTISSYNTLLHKRDKILRYFAFNNIKDTGLNDYTQQQPTNYYSTLASSLMSITSSLSSSSTPSYMSQTSLSRRVSTNLNFVYDDLDLLRIILASAANSTINYFSYSNANSNASSTPINSIKSTSQYLNNAALVNLDASDLNIVKHILKTLKIKQIYLYNLAMQKKRLKEFRNKRLLLKKSASAKKTDQIVIAVNNSTVIDLAENEVGKKLSSNDDDDNEACNLNFDINVQMPLLVEYEELVLFSSNRK